MLAFHVLWIAANMESTHLEKCLLEKCGWCRRELLPRQLVRLQDAYVQNKQRVSCQAKFKQPLAFSEVRKNMRSCVSFSSHFLSHTVSNDSRRRSPHNCTTEETDRNSHRADRRSAFGPGPSCGSHTDTFMLNPTSCNGLLQT